MPLLLFLSKRRIKWLWRRSCKKISQRGFFYFTIAGINIVLSNLKYGINIFILLSVRNFISYGELHETNRGLKPYKHLNF